MQFTVGFLKADPNARYQGYMFYFKEGFCWTNILNPNARLLKAKLKSKTVNDVGSMSLSSNVYLVPNYYLVALLNSNILFDYYREYINCTVNIQINDIRQLPIVIPTSEQIVVCKLLAQRAIELKKRVFKGMLQETEIEAEMFKIEAKLNDFVCDLYYSI